MSTTQYRPRRSRAEWQTLIEQAEHSALSISAFCHAEDLSLPRSDLTAMLPRLGRAAVRTPPMPHWLLILAEHC